MPFFAPAPKGMTPTQKGATWAVIAAALVMPWEGLYLKTYKDRLAHNLLTVCYGMTPSDRPVHLGDKYTKEECKHFLIADLPKYQKPLQRCIKVQISQHNWAALVSAAYNAGSRAVCHSPMVRRFNNDDPNGACNSFVGWYERAGGQWRRGLHNRRMDERRVCLIKDNLEDDDEAT